MVVLTYLCYECPEVLGVNFGKRDSVKQSVGIGTKI